MKNISVKNTAHLVCISYVEVTLKSRLDAKHLPAYLPEEATAEDKKAKFSNIIVDGENDVTFTSSWPRIRLTTTFHQKFL